MLVAPVSSASGGPNTSAINAALKMYTGDEDDIRRAKILKRNEEIKAYNKRWDR